MASVGRVNFTLRQWAVIVGLAAGFIVAAVLLGDSDDGDAAGDPIGEFDEVVWCEAANAISAWSSVLDGSVDGDSLDDVRNLRQALDDARPLAPADLGFDLARLQDFALLVEQGAEREGDLAAGLAPAQANTDPPRVAEAIDRVDGALVACGHPAIGR